MSFITGSYDHTRSENFAEYLLAMGVPESQLQKYCGNKAQLEINHNGNCIGFFSYCAERPYTAKYYLDEEIDEKVSEDMTIKSIASLEGNTLTIVSENTTNKTKGKRIFEFSEDELVVTLINCKPGGLVAKRYYRRLP